MRLRRLKPGSIDQNGNVIDYYGGTVGYGPCWIPANLSGARKQALGDAGWHVTPVTHWPGIMPTQGLMCIHRGPLS